MGFALQRGTGLEERAAAKCCAAQLRAPLNHDRFCGKRGMQESASRMMA
jgi:hypothetical protein